MRGNRCRFEGSVVTIFDYMKEAPIIILFLLPTLASFGQVNLIPNGGFEDLDTCPVFQSCAGNIEFALGWFEPINCTSDVLHECSAEAACDIPFSMSGFPESTVYPFEGQGMGHIILYGDPLVREYAEIRLLEPLMKDSVYVFSIRLRLKGGTLGASVGSFGAYFSSDSVLDYSLNHTLLELPAQLQRDPNLMMDDHSLWYLWEDTLIAEGNEEFVVIGNFLSNLDTPYDQPSSYPGAACFLDEVSLVRIPAFQVSNSISESKIGFVISPNPTADKFRISYSGSKIGQSVSIYSIDGKFIKERRYTDLVPVSDLSKGTYVIKILFDDGTQAFERLIVQ